MKQTKLIETALSRVQDLSKHNQLLDTKIEQSQKKQILKALQNGDRLTKIEMLRRFGCWNSGNIIFLLRNEGHNIKTEMIQDIFNGKRFAIYSLEKK